MNEEIKIQEPTNPALGMSRCCTLADAPNELNHEAQKIKNAKRGGISFFCIDNIEFMKTKPDKYYDLAIVDPPYGNNDAIGMKDNTKCKKQATKRTNYEQFENIAPTEEYWSELKRVSKNQIVWGGNWFGLKGGFICWNKFGTAFGQAELAYCSLIKSVKVYEYVWNGMLQQNMKDKEIRIHPTQKPVALYKWLLNEFAKTGFKILDTHGGSMSHAIACDEMKYELDICEINEKYFNEGLQRFDLYKRQLKLF